MKILILSDLHYDYQAKYVRSFFRESLINAIIQYEYDLIVISGDILESNVVLSKENPYRIIHELLGNNCPVVCCFGNHEFAYWSIQEIKNYYLKWKEHYNIHYLDLQGRYEIEGLNFIGNVFWYDHSLNKNKFYQGDRISSHWLDSKIIDFIPSLQNKKCKQQIKENIVEGKTNILVTHMVPHEELNWFSEHEPFSLYNGYSGSKDFLNEIKVDYCVCGHTHKRVIKEINGVKCINVGNDYLFKSNIKTYLLEI